MHNNGIKKNQLRGPQDLIGKSLAANNNAIFLLENGESTWRVKKWSEKPVEEYVKVSVKNLQQ